MFCGRVLLRDARPKTRGFGMDPLPYRGGGFGTGGTPIRWRTSRTACGSTALRWRGGRETGRGEIRRCPGYFLQSNFSPLCPRKAQLSVRERLSRSEPLLTILSARRGDGTLKRLLCMPSLTCTVHHAPSRAYHRVSVRRARCTAGRWSPWSSAGSASCGRCSETGDRTRIGPRRPLDYVIGMLTESSPKRVVENVYGLHSRGDPLPPTSSLFLRLCSSSWRGASLPGWRAVGSALAPRNPQRAVGWGGPWVNRAVPASAAPRKHQAGAASFRGCSCASARPRAYRRSSWRLLRHHAARHRTPSRTSPLRRPQPTERARAPSERRKRSGLPQTWLSSTAVPLFIGTPTSGEYKPTKRPAPRRDAPRTSSVPWNSSTVSPVSRIGTLDSPRSSPSAADPDRRTRPESAPPLRYHSVFMKLRRPTPRTAPGKLPLCLPRHDRREQAFAVLRGRQPGPLPAGPARPFSWRFARRSPRAGP